MGTKDTGINKISKSNIVNIRFITSLISYLFLLIGSSIVVYFAFKRGNPIALEVLYCFALVFNLVQIVLLVVNFTLKNLGIYNNKIGLVEDIILMIWGAIILSEFIAACAIFDMFRVDCFLISTVQGLVLLLMLYFNKKIDFFVNHMRSKDNEKNDLRNPQNLKRRENTKTVLYLSICICVFVIEIIALSLPMMPPRVDDMFAEERLLHYTYFDNIKGREDGYYVTDTYLGANDKIIIPLTYNNKPVVGIASNAINDKGEINSIQIGEYNDKGELESNIKYIDPNGIKLNRIKNIDLPASIETLGKNAITGQNIKTLNYMSKNAINSNNFKMESLTNLNLLNEEHSVQFDIENFNVDIHVPLNLYNNYREQYFENRNVFEVEEKEENFIIDFETGCNYYLDSKFVNKNDAKLNITALKNNGEETSSLIQDTAIYNADHYSCEGYISNPGYVFRGWYRDPEFTKGMECVFTDSSNVYFSEDTTLYAKWEAVKVVELKWDTYCPYNEHVTRFNFVSTEDLNQSIDFPKYEGKGGDISRIGYKDLVWTYGDKTVEKTADLADIEGDVITIHSNWILKTPTLTYKTQVGNAEYSELEAKPKFVFDENQRINFIASFGHELDTVKIKTQFKKIDENGNYVLVEEKPYSYEGVYSYILRNYADSGSYCIEIVATSPDGETSTINKLYNLEIERKEIQNIKTLDILETIYNGNEQDYKYPYGLPSDIKYTVRYKINGEYQTTPPRNANKNAYDVEFTFVNVGEEYDNYNPKKRYSSMVIKQKELKADWRQEGLNWNSNFETLYNGEMQILKPNVIGSCGSDSVSFILNNPNRNCGRFMSEIIGVNNPNYYFDVESENAKHLYDIKARPITFTWVNKNLPYTGKEINFRLNVQGICTFDKANIKLDNFGITTDCGVYYNSVDSYFVFSAKNANTYEVNIESFSDSNYIIENVYNSNFVVNKTQLNAVWNDASLNTIYNGQIQSAKLSINGFKNNEGELYSTNKIKELFNISANCDYRVGENHGDYIVIYFDAINADTYSLIFDGIKQSDNYFALGKNAEYSIAQRKLEGKWYNTDKIYNRENQHITYEFTNICSKDGMLFANEDFNTTGSAKFKLVNNSTENRSDVKVEFYNKDAGTYSANLSLVNAVKFNNNYIFEPIQARLNIAKLPLVVKWSADSFVYNADYREITATVLNSGNDPINLTYADNKFINANITGSYEARILSCGNDNYSISYLNNHKWSITKKPIKITYEDNTSIYNGKYQTVKVMFDGFEEKDLVQLTSNSIVYNLNDQYSSLKINSSSVIGNKFVTSFSAIDAAPYEVKISNTKGDLFNNYQIDSLSLGFEITPLKLTYTWAYEDGFIPTYDNAVTRVIPTLTNLCCREDVPQEPLSPTYDKVIFEMQGAEALNAGNAYEAKIINIDNHNYYLDELDESLVFKWQINKKEITATWDTPIKLAFNANHNIPTPSSTNIYPDDEVIFKYEYKKANNIVPQTKDVGNYTLQVVAIEGREKDNYCLPANLGTSYDIEPLKLNISAQKNQKIYDKMNHLLYSIDLGMFPTENEAKEFFKTEGLVLQGSIKNSLDKLISGRKIVYNFYGIQAGDYPLQITGINNPNYAIDTYSDTVSIKQKVVELAWPSNEFVYDGKIKNFIPTITNKAGNDDFVVTVTCSGHTALGNSTSNISAVDAGSYTVTVNGVTNGNYTLDNGITSCSDLTKVFEIKRRSITVGIANSPTLVYDGTRKGININIAGFIESDKNLFNENPLNIENTGESEKYKLNTDGKQATLTVLAVNAGTYNYGVNSLISKFDNSNYKFDTSKTFSNTYTINKANTLVSWPTTKLTYSGEEQTIIATALNQSLYTNVLTGEKDIVEFTYNGNKAVNANNYTASIVGVSNDNYAKPKQYQYSWSILPKKLIQKSNFTGMSFEYNGQKTNCTLTISGFIPKDMGSISSATLITSIDSNLVTNTIKNSDNMVLEFGYIDVNNYKYNITGISDTNYSIATTFNNFSILQKPVSFTFDTNSFEYDGAQHKVVCTVNGLVERVDTAVYDDVKAEVRNSSATIAGNYIAEVYNLTGTNAKNYKISENNTHNWVIKKHVLQATWSNDNNFVYDGKTHVVKLTLSSFKNSDANNIRMSQFVGNYAVSGTIGVDSQSVVISFNIRDVKPTGYTFNFEELLDNNYSANIAKTTVIISPKQITAEKDNVSTLIYDGTNKGVDVFLKGICNEDKNQMENDIVINGGSYTVNKNIEGGMKFTCLGNGVKSYKHTISLSNRNLNYTFSNCDVIFTITPRELSFQWNLPEKTNNYDGLFRSLVLEISGISPNAQLNEQDFQSIGHTIISSQKVNNETIQLALNGIKNVGKYDYNIKVINPNYWMNSCVNSYEITKKSLSVEQAISNYPSYVYNGELQGHKLIVKGFCNPDDAENAKVLLNNANSTVTKVMNVVGNTLEISYPAIEVSAQSLTYAGFVSDNYGTIDINDSYSITPHSLNIEKIIAEGPLTYTGALQGNMIKITGFVSASDAKTSSNNINSLITCDGGKYIVRPGENEIIIDYKNIDAVSLKRISLLDKSINKNYVKIGFDDQFSINKATLTVEDNNNVVYPYDGLSKSNTIRIKGFKKVEDVRLAIESIQKSKPTVVSCNYQESANELQITYSAINNGSYSFNFISNALTTNYNNVEINDSYKIEKRALKVDKSGEPTAHYTGQLHGKVITISNFANIDDARKAIEVIKKNVKTNVDLVFTPYQDRVEIQFKAINIGQTYSIKLEIISVNDNYNTITFDDSFVIQECPIYVNTADSTAIEYTGQLITRTISLTNFQTQKDVIDALEILKQKGIVNVEADTNNSIKIVIKAVDVGSYPLTYSGKILSNYSNVEISDTLTISPATLRTTRRTEGQNSYLYDGNYKTNTITIGQFATEQDAINAKNELIKHAIVSNNNLMVTLSNKSLIVTYPSKNVTPEVTFSYVGKINNNYKDINVTDYYAITKATLNVSSSSTKSFTYNGQNQSVTITISGFKGSDINTANNIGNVLVTNGINYFVNKNVNSLEITFDTKNVGNYSYSLNGKLHDNYADIVFNEEQYTIVPVKLNVAIVNENYSGTYSGISQGRKITISNFVEKDDVNKALNYIRLGNISNTRITYNTNPNSIDIYYLSTNAGNFKFEFEGTLNEFGNYNAIDKISDSFIISQKELSLTNNTTTGVIAYDGLIHSNSMTLSGFISNDDANAAMSSLMASNKNAQIEVSGTTINIVYSGTNVGVHSYIFNSSVGKNYLDVVINDSFEITERTLLISPITKDVITYNGLSQNKNIVISEFKNILEVEHAIQILRNSLVGDYIITNNDNSITLTYGRTNVGLSKLVLAEQCILGSNYAPIQAFEDSREIQQAKLTVSPVSDKVYTYKGNIYESTVIISGFFNTSEVEDALDILKTNLQHNINCAFEADANSITIRYGQQDVGKATISINQTISLGGNYKSINQFTDSIQVTKATLECEILGEQILPYNGLNQSRLIYIKGFKTNVDRDLAMSRLQQLINITNATIETRIDPFNNENIIVSYSAKNKGTYKFNVNDNLGENYNNITISDGYQIITTQLDPIIQSHTSENVNGSYYEKPVVISGFKTVEDAKIAEETLIKALVGFSGTITQEGNTVVLRYMAKDEGVYRIEYSGIVHEMYDPIEINDSLTLTNVTLNNRTIGTDAEYDGLAHKKTIIISGFRTELDVQDAINILNVNLVKSPNLINVNYIADGLELKIEFEATKVGQYNISYNGSLGVGYNNLAFNETIIISKTNLNIIMSGSQVYSYNGEKQGREIQILGFKNLQDLDEAYRVANSSIIYQGFISTSKIIDDTLGIKIVYEGKDVQKYTFALKECLEINYNNVDITDSFVINKLLLNPINSTKTIEFVDGNSHEKTIVISGFVNELDAKVAYDKLIQELTNYKVTQMGTSIEIQYSGITEGEYILTYNGSVHSNYENISIDDSLTLQNTSLQINVQGNNSIIYNGTPNTKSIKVSGFRNVDDANYAVSVINRDIVISNDVTTNCYVQGEDVIIEYSATNYGTHTLSYNGNVCIGYNTLNIDDSFVINKKDVSVNVESLKTGDLQFENVVISEPITSNDYQITYYNNPDKLEAVEFVGAPGTYYYAIVLTSDNYNLTNAEGSFVIETI